MSKSDHLNKYVLAVHIFNEEYGRIPKKHEIESIVGSLKPIFYYYNSYNHFLSDYLGLDIPGGRERSLEVIHSRTNEVITTGLPRFIALVYCVDYHTVNRHAKNGTLFKDIYKIVPKPVDVKLMKRKIKEAIKQ